MVSPNVVHTIKPCSCSREQIRLFGTGCTFSQKLARVPEHRITVGDFVHREVALEHRARSPKRFDAGLDVWAKFSSKHFGRWRFGLLIEAESVYALTKPADFDINVLVGSKRLY